MIKSCFVISIAQSCALTHLLIIADFRTIGGAIIGVLFLNSKKHGVRKIQFNISWIYKDIFCQP